MQQRPTEKKQNSQENSQQQPSQPSTAEVLVRPEAAQPQQDLQAQLAKEARQAKQLWSAVEVAFESRNLESEGESLQRWTSTQGTQPSGPIDEQLAVFDLRAISVDPSIVPGCDDVPPLPCGELTTYFSDAYLAGEKFEGVIYHCEEDAKLRLPILRQCEGGMPLYAEALDLRPASPNEPFRVLYHYTHQRSQLMSILLSRFARAVPPDMELVECMAVACAAFGQVVYLSNEEPSEIVCNISGSCSCLLCQALEDLQTTASEIIEDTTRQPEFDLVVPILVPTGLLHTRVAIEDAAGAQNLCCRFRPDDRGTTFVPLTRSWRAKMEAAGCTCRLGLREKRLERLKLRHGGDHPDTCRALADLAAAHRSAGNLAMADALFRHALAGAAAGGGPDHPSTIALLVDLAETREAAGHLREAADLLRCAMRFSRSGCATQAHGLPIAVARSSLGLFDDFAPPLKSGLRPLTWRCNAALARVLRALGNERQAEAYLSLALEGCGEAHGPKHPLTLTCEHDLGMLWLALEQYGVAEMHLRRAMAGRLEVLGPSHLETMSSALELASAAQSLGRAQEAEVLITSVVQSAQDSFGRDHPTTARCHHRLGLLHKQQGKRELAERLLRKSAYNQQKALGVGHCETLRSLDALADLMKVMGKSSDAEIIYRHVLGCREATAGPTNPEALASLDRLGTFLKDVGKMHEADPLLRRAFEGRRAVLGPLHPETLASATRLAAVLALVGRAQEAHALYLASLHGRARLLMAAGHSKQAVPFFRRAFEGREAELGPSHLDTLSSMSGLIAALTTAGSQRHGENPDTVEGFTRGAEAETLLRRALELREITQGPTHPDTLDILVGLARCLAATKKELEAEPLFGRALEGLTATLGPAHAETVACCTELAALLEKREQLEVEPPLRLAFQGKYEALGSFCNAAEAYKHLTDLLQETDVLCASTLVTGAAVLQQDFLALAKGGGSAAIGAPSSSFPTTSAIAAPIAKPLVFREEHYQDLPQRPRQPGEEDVIIGCTV